MPGCRFEMGASYRELVMQAVDTEKTDTIRQHLQHQRIYGPDRFRLAIKRQLGRKLGTKEDRSSEKCSHKNRRRARKWTLNSCFLFSVSLLAADKTRPFHCNSK